ncbi:hypothetical protein [Mesorhizobium sp. WSM4904]|uniref:hypothetical protein n=1 Tax=Mesorhizobium sp. WSM4904 TaxID=3038545 RepID=UPI0024186839|nr:hypothetical protein [Mesorhizobium sp. WSM4904]WFP66235.1 hypothetical protein QAZ47_09290 [Mesorhizobium sp. WSM4904]
MPFPCSFATVEAGSLSAAARRAGVPPLEPFEQPPWPVRLVHADQGLLPVKLRAFLDLAAPRLKERRSSTTAPFSFWPRLV